MSSPQQRDPGPLRSAREHLDAAVRAYIQAGDELDLADAERTGEFEEAEEVRRRMTSHITHWVVVVSRTRWQRDPDDPGDPEEHPATGVQVGAHDESSSAWVLSGLLREGLTALSEGR